MMLGISKEELELFRNQNPPSKVELKEKSEKLHKRENKSWKTILDIIRTIRSISFLKEQNDEENV